VSSLAQTDALAKLLIEKGVITQQEFSAKILEERANVPGNVKADSTLTQMNPTRNSSLTPLTA
jgi:hypothetical protein